MIDVCIFIEVFLRLHKSKPYKLWHYQGRNHCDMRRSSCRLSVVSADLASRHDLLSRAVDGAITLCPHPGSQKLAFLALSHPGQANA